MRSVLHLILRCVVGIILLFPAFLFAQNNLIINEVMGSNFDYFPDEDGTYADWIELYNGGNEAINLNNYGLSDNAQNPLKWSFPEYFIQPNEHLLVWASGKDRKPLDRIWTQGITRKVYHNIPGARVEDLLEDPRFPDEPDFHEVVKSFFESPSNIGDNYGQHMYTWIKPPATGKYTFWIAGDDNCQLLLSPDENTSNGVLIAEVPEWTPPRDWNRFSVQRSEQIFLEQGKYYFLSALMKEGGGSDNLAVRWQLPSGQIDGPISTQYCFLPHQYFHTNYSISGDGEEIVLTAPGGQKIDEMPAWPIPSNISLGRTLSHPDDWVYFEKTTPGHPNPDSGFDRISSKLVIQPAGGFFANPVLVSMSGETGDIYYTTDGTAPNPNNGIRYSSPFLISGSVRLRAALFQDGAIGSEIVGASFGILSDSISNFTSNLPIMVLQQFDTLISPGNRTISYMTLFDSPEVGRYPILSKEYTQGRININIRGSSSQSFPKKGYGFHLLEENGRNRKEALLGMPEEHNWVLHGPYSDKTLLRNVIAYEMSNDIGQYSPRTRLIELFMHDGSGALNESHYHGVYVLVERIKVAPGRVEIEDLETYHNDGPEITGGYIFKKDRLNEGEEGFRTLRGSLYAHDKPDERTITPAQSNYLTSYVDSVETALFGPNFTDQELGYEAYIDVASFIDYHLLTEVCKEIDGYRFSTFFYKDRNGKLILGPLWDYNLSLGNADYNEGWNPEGWYYPLISEYDYLNGWFNRLFEDKKFEQQYKQRYRQLRNAAFSTPRLLNKISGYAELLEEAQVRNFNRWNTLGTYVWPNWFIGDTYQEEIDFMSKWLDERLIWMDGQLGGAYNLIHYWNFNIEDDFLTPSFTFGDGELTISPGSQTEVTTGTGQDFIGENARSDDPTGSHLRVNYPIGTELLFSIPSSGFKDLTFSYETRRSGSGANTQYISYTTNGEEYISLDTIMVTTEPTLHIYNFDRISAANNNEHFAIKIAIDQIGSGEGGDVGNNRFDNVTLDGEALDGVNLPPAQVLSLPNPIQVTVSIDEALNLNNYFSDPDGDILIYTVEAENPGICTAHVNDSSLSITSISQGETILQLTVSDGFNQPLSQDVRVLLYPEPFVIADHTFEFDFWDENEPEGLFPEHMIFLQSNLEDTDLTDELLYAYYIPEDDYSDNDMDNIGFPYRNESRTRINGLGSEGFSFINTGRGRDLGAALISLNTLNTSKVSIDWTASTLRANSRVYAFRPQFRIGQDGVWQNFLDSASEIIEYERSSIINQKVVFQEMLLPSSALNQPNVQIAWKYYYTGERLSSNSGARDMLAIHHIKIEGDLGTSTVEVNLSGKLELWPNPLRGNELYFNKVTSGYIFDIHGRPFIKVNNTSKIDIGINLPAGLYIYRSLDGEALRFVVQ